MLALALALQIAAAGAAATDSVCTPLDEPDRQISIAIGDGSPSRPDSARLAAEQARRDSIIEARALRAADPDSARARCRPAKTARRTVVTPEHVRTAFATPAVRALYERARASRTKQDSALIAYDAKAYQRVSVHFGFRKIGRQRLLFRSENASRVRWQRDGVAQIDLLGARTAVPIVKSAKFGASESGEIQREIQQEMQRDMGEAFASSITPVPYYPGRDQLLPMLNNGAVKFDADEQNLIHPLADGAEAFYRFSLGDSAEIRLGDGRSIRIQEIQVRPRRPRWNLAVASLWFDTGSWHLVRASYRFSEPMDIEAHVKEEDPTEFEDVPGWIRPAIFPMSANVSGLTVEYGLHQGRFWLPRMQLLEGEARAGIMRITFDLRERFTYASVNAAPDAPLVVAPRVRSDSLYARIRRDSTLSDSAKRAMRRALTDSLRAVAREAHQRQCAESGRYSIPGRRHEGRLPVTVTVPCDTTVLARSSELPPSIYDEGEETFGGEELEALRDELLSFKAQSDFEPQRPRLEYGIGMTRYNRVEGISTGIRADQTLGAGYTARAEARLGAADLQPNAEARLARTDGRRTLALGAYRRLAVANDWGNPLGFGASVNALLFGRDEGFYYRTAGVELAAIGEGRSVFEYRLFVERHDEAERRTHASLARLINGVRFDPNIAAREGELFGTSLRMAGSRGADPHGLRLFGDLRAEGGAGTWGYGRIASDVTVSHGLGRRFTGALTFGGGTSTGDVPVQRMWFLGGSGTVRGQRPGTLVGDAYWLGRAELGASWVGARPILFYDVGWAGSRELWQNPGRPASGAGVGASFLDGLIRIDLARGIWPEKRVRADVYVEARF